ncbi:hypothetical protein L2E82_13130 [Cichorium intybus]|uniref:Uncharacterized protein n=1 Tax=Cichorium intybus TaxID=13427 RepID=A0ACB9GHS9_CICIN|nr:hypothetical protein L2E82_13130 [Cichorium intybus]
MDLRCCLMKVKMLSLTCYLMLEVANVELVNGLKRVILVRFSKKSLADRFEFVMHGLLYKILDDKNQNGDAQVAVYISFGRLQLLMKGAPVKMGKFKVDQRLFLLLLKELMSSTLTWF